MGMTTTQPTPTTFAAEDAPIDVQLWPTTSPKYANNFTLKSVARVRTAYGEHVLWTYYSGTTRTFAVGEQVACELAAADA